MIRSRRRRAMTFVEIMVAAVLLIMVLGGAWFFFTAARRQTDQAFKYSSVLQSAASIGARLQIDLAAAYVPPGDPLSSDLFQIEDDGRKLGFTRSPPETNAEEATTSGGGRRWLEYSTEPGPNGTYFLKRTLGDHVTRWIGTPCKELKFELLRPPGTGRTFLVAELVLIDEDTAERPGLSNRRPFAMRVVKRLRDPANFSGVGGRSFPLHILGPLQGDPGTSSPLPVDADPSTPPVAEEGVGLEVNL